MRLVFFIAFCAGLLATAPATAQNVENVGPAAKPIMNALRAQNGLSPVTLDKTLTKAATSHARDMQKNGFFSHTGSDGSSVGDRARKVRYGFCFIAENIAKGQGSLQQVMDGWMNSPGHRRNILSDQAREFALVRGAGNHWVMVLGRPGC